MIAALKVMYSSNKSVVKYKTQTSDAIHSVQGVKQGDASSSLLFMMYVNGIAENIDVNIDGFFTLNELKLFLSFFSSILYSHFIFMYISFVIIIYRQFTKYIIIHTKERKSSTTRVFLYTGQYRVAPNKHARTHAYTHTRTHAHIHTRTPNTQTCV